jgi:hypothetical protein
MTRNTLSYGPKTALLELVRADREVRPVAWM